MWHQLLLTTTTILLTTLPHLITAIPAISPQTSPPPPTPKDPCGPVIQDPLDPTIPFDTCHTNITYTTTPSTRGAMLLNDPTTPNHMNYFNCFPIVLDVCAALTSPLTPTGVWNWTGVGSQCVMGFWLPIYTGAAPIPSVEQCERNIYLPMRDIGRKWGGERYNQVVVNLDVLPDDTQNGSQVSAGYPSYTITVLPLIRGDEAVVPA